MSQVLGQSELLAPAPLRRMQVPRPGFGWWGIDPSTERVSIAWVNEAGERGVETKSFPPRRGAIRLAAIRQLTHEFAGELQYRHPAAFVYLEQPSGKQINLPLAYAVGVIQEAVQSALLRFTDGFEPQVATVTSSAWKKQALGRGDVYKPKKNDSKPYYALVWAQQTGYTGRLWDEADAWGIAEAARRAVGFDLPR